MFAMDNTEGFTAEDIELLNSAVSILMEKGIDEKNASAIVNNNWRETGNTIDSLVKI